MKYYYSLILILLLILAGCSSVPNVNSDDTEDKEISWSKRLGSLLSKDPVPSEIKIKKGNNIVAEVVTVRDGDTITISNVDTSNIEDTATANKINSVLKSNGNTLGVRFISIDTPEITNGKNEYFGVDAKETVEEMLYRGTIILELDDKALFDN